MGITIHYDLTFKGTSEQVREKLEILRKKVIDSGLALLITEMGEITEIDCSKVKDKPISWLYIQYVPFELKIKESPEELRKYKGFAIEFLVDEYSEQTNIGLVSKDGNNWIGSTFTKTQYAKDFVKAHLSVIKILDFCNEIGILKDVFDEGGYWDTRDINVLGDNINMSTIALEKLAEALRNVENNEFVISPIDEHKNFVLTEKQTEKQRDNKNKNKNVKKIDN